MEKFTYKNTISNNKILIVSKSSLARRIAAEYLLQSFKFSTVNIKEDFYALNHVMKQEVFDKSEVILSIASSDFMSLRADGIIIQLDMYVSNAMTYEDMEKTIHGLLDQIKINTIKPIINPHLNGSPKICTCPGNVWRSQGCKCGAISPYVERY